MNGFPNPDSWMDVVTIVIVSLIVAVPSVLAARNQRGIRRNNTGIEELCAQTAAIRDQVVNGHDGAPPLRSDIDAANSKLDRLASELARTRDQIETLREDLTLERVSRRDQVRELREDVDSRLQAHDSRLQALQQSLQQRMHSTER